MITEIPLEIHHIYIAILKRNCKPTHYSSRDKSMLVLTGPDGQNVFVSLPDFTAFVS